jgi:hypothetical protein
MCSAQLFLQPAQKKKKVFWHSPCWAEKPKCIQFQSWFIVLGAKTFKSLCFQTLNCYTRNVLLPYMQGSTAVSYFKRTSLMLWTKYPVQKLCPNWYGFIAIP